MGHVAKYNSSASGHLMAHFERKKDEVTGEYIKFGNQNIDTEKSHENYNLCPRSEGSQIDFFRERLSEVKVQKRDDVKTLCSWVITLPQGEYTQEQEKAFFAESYRFLSERYGERNVVSAFVHKDETQPHLHFAFVPVVPDTKWNDKHPDKPREKVSAKECLTRQDLQTFHVEFQDRLDNQFGELVFSVLNGATLGGNQTLEQLQYETVRQRSHSEMNSLLEEVENEQEKLSQLRREVYQVRGEKVTLHRDTDALRGEYEALRGNIEQAKQTLEVVTEAVKEKADDGVKQFGMAGMQERIARAKVESEKSNRLRLLEKFVAIPQIKELFDRFCQQVRGKTKGLDNER